MEKPSNHSTSTAKATTEPWCHIHRFFEHFQVGSALSLWKEETEHPGWEKCLRHPRQGHENLHQMNYRLLCGRQAALCNCSFYLVFFPLFSHLGSIVTTLLGWWGSAFPVSSLHQSWKIPSWGKTQIWQTPWASSYRKPTSSVTIWRTSWREGSSGPER